MRRARDRDSPDVLNWQPPFYHRACQKILRKTHTIHHKCGSLWARGKTVKCVMVGHWEWFRKDGMKLRSGRFEKGEQTGEWVTCDHNGAAYKVTQFKPKAKRPT